MEREITKQAMEITGSDGQEAILIQNTDKKFNNILIVELNGVLRVIDKETKTLTQILGEMQNKHAYYTNRAEIVVGMCLGTPIFILDGGIFRKKVATLSDFSGNDGQIYQFLFIRSGNKL